MHACQRREDRHALHSILHAAYLCWHPHFPPRCGTSITPQPAPRSCNITVCISLLRQGAVGGGAAAAAARDRGCRERGTARPTLHCRTRAAWQRAPPNSQRRRRRALAQAGTGHRDGANSYAPPRCQGPAAAALSAAVRDGGCGALTRVTVWQTS